MGPGPVGERARILALPPEWLRDAAGLLAASFHDDPVYSTIFERPETRAHRLRTFMGTALRDAVGAGEAQAALVEGRLAGAAAWLPPGAFPWSAARKARAAPGMLGILLRDPRGGRRLARLGTGIEEAFPGDEPVWYLEVIGVHPELQGLGVGSALLREGLRRVDAERRDCYLETPTEANVRLYRRFGFEVERAGVELLPDGPTHWTMRRPAAPDPDRSRAVRSAEAG
jgi:ribosomal protein S18 acetylase RimI-like enzyme